MNLYQNFDHWRYVDVNLLKVTADLNCSFGDTQVYLMGTAQDVAATSL
jgi:hypothetical protein